MKMEQMIPLQYLTKNFQIKIKSLSHISTHKNISHYSAITQYGQLHFIQESYTAQINGYPTEKHLKVRNSMLQSNPLPFVSIYQQQIIINHPQQIVCLTLLQHINKFQATNAILTLQNMDHLIKSVAILNKNGMAIQGRLRDGLVYCINGGDIKINFTKIIHAHSQEQQQYMLASCIQMIQQLLQTDQKSVILQDKLYKLNPESLKTCKSVQELQLVLNLHPTLYAEVQLKPLLQKSKSILHQHQPPPQLQKQSSDISQKIGIPESLRLKTVRVSELLGRERIRIDGIWYQGLEFVDGKCVNALKQISDQNYIHQIINNNNVFTLQNKELVYLNVQHKVENGKIELINVGDGVEKIDFINFIIMYLTHKQPIIQSIDYSEPTNSLILSCFHNPKHPSTPSLTHSTSQHCQTKKNPGSISAVAASHSSSTYSQRTEVRIRFPSAYIIKDQEISMLVERGTLYRCRLNIKYMRVNDTLFMFLANSDKMLNVVAINASDCYGITDLGVNLLIQSAYSKNLQQLSLQLKNSLFHLSLQSLGNNPKLHSLNLQAPNPVQTSVEPLSPSCLASEHQSLQSLPLHTHNIESLILHNIKIPITSSYINIQHMRVLELTQYVNVDELRGLKNANFTRLKIRLVDNRKSLMDSASGFISGVVGTNKNPIKVFAQGNAAKTLKYLDLSYSTIKLKALQPLLQMPKLEQLVLNSLPHPGHECQPLCPKISRLSLCSTSIPIQSLECLLETTPILVELILVNSPSIQKQQLLKYIRTRKKFINNLIIGYKLYSEELLEKINSGGSKENTGGYELVENIAVLFNIVNKNYASDHQIRKFEAIVEKIVAKTVQVQKSVKILTTMHQHDGSRVSEIKMRSQQAYIVQIVTRYLKLVGKSKKHLKNLQINNKSYSQHLSQQQPIAEKGPLLQESLHNRQQVVSILPTRPPTMHLQLAQKFPICSLLQLVSTLPQNYHISVNMANNKTLPKQAIKILHTYCGDRLTGLNFYNCAFGFQEVIDYLLDFQKLEQCNNGHCYINLDSNNFTYQVHRYLTLYMRIPIKQVQVIVNDIISAEDVEILYNVLTHLIDKNKDSITSVSISFNNVEITKDMQLLIQTISQLNFLNCISIALLDVRFNNSKSLQKQDIFNSLNKLRRLTKLELNIPSACFPIFHNANNMKELSEVYLTICDQQLTQSLASKLLRPLHSAPISILHLNLSGCQISNIVKIFSISPNSNLLQKLTHLTSLQLQLQYCNIKQSYLFQLLHLVSKCKMLTIFKADFSYGNGGINYGEFINQVNLMMVDIGKEDFVCQIACVMQILIYAGLIQQKYNTIKLTSTPTESIQFFDF